MVIKPTIINVLFAETYVNVVFVISCLYSAVTLTLVKEQRLIRIINIIINIIITVSLFPHILGSRFQPEHLRGQLGVKTSVTPSLPQFV